MNYDEFIFAIEQLAFKSDDPDEEYLILDYICDLMHIAINGHDIIYECILIHLTPYLYGDILTAYE